MSRPTLTKARGIDHMDLLLGWLVFVIFMMSIGIFGSAP